MKNAISIMLILLFTACTYAQQGINYRALIRDNSGNILANKTIDVRFTVIADSGPTDVYLETHTGAIIDANGILILTIGDGTSRDVFANIDRGSDIHSLKVEIDIEQDGSFADMGTTQFMAVPDALQSKTTTTAENTFSGDSNDLTNQPTISTYKVNTFYAELGGYVIEVRDGGKHGLVVAMQDQGVSNWFEANNLLSDAAKHDINGAKFTDWRLPTKRELNVMYSKRLDIGGFDLSNSAPTFSYYWSSTEDDFNNAWTPSFTNGNQLNLNKNYTNDVRGVRAF